jgi:alkanesulfonate monooxygenase SsuD/methylene tetrahydromethanopterin reductase-like flavin-dependent oxidoreductase (luciferase family)
MAEGGIMFAGTPDQLYDQMVKFNDRCGGIGHMLMLSQAGYLSHDETVDTMTMFAEQVAPRLREYAKQKNEQIIQAAE